MRPLQVVSTLLFLVAGIALMLGLVCLFAIRQPAMGWASIGGAFVVLLVALVIEGAWRISRQIIDLLERQNAALQVIVGRRGKQ